MIRHLLRLVWNRKRSTALVMVEITASFIVLAIVLVGAAYTMSNWNKPLGFTRENVLLTSMDRNASMGRGASAEDVQRAKNVLAEVERMDGVVAAGYTSTPPYVFSEWASTVKHKGEDVMFHVDTVTDGFAETVGLQLLEGRWFSAEDDALAFEPIVIDTDFAKTFYGDESPIGKPFAADDGEKASPGEPETRVVGVVADYRKGGEASQTSRFMFRRLTLEGTDVDQIPYYLAIRVTPGSAERVAREMTTTLRSVAPGWTFETQPLDSHRRSALKMVLIPISIGVIIGGFLVLMVALGLIGVLWQAVILRAGELGLRRAVGATRAAIRSQILGETATITTLAVIVGLLLIAQIPLLGMMSFIPAKAWLGGVASALVVIYAVTLLAGTYPSRIATRVDPATVLRTE